MNVLSSAPLSHNNRAQAVLLVAGAEGKTEQAPAQKQTSSTSSEDKVSISVEGTQKAASSPKTTHGINDKKDDPNALTEEEQKQVKELKLRDAEVRTHEQAHAAVGGQYAGAPSYEFQRGPDGNRYAVGGEVQIDVGEEKDPESTIQKMQVVRRAALAPAEPSSQDYKVAAEASQKELAARAELGKEQTAERNAASTDGAANKRNESSNDERSNRSIHERQIQQYTAIQNAPTQGVTSANSLLISA